jgi:hypothetical protein
MWAHNNARSKGATFGFSLPIVRRALGDSVDKSTTTPIIQPEQKN